MSTRITVDEARFFLRYMRDDGGKTLSFLAFNHRIGRVAGATVQLQTPMDMDGLENTSWSMFTTQMWTQVVATADGLTDPAYFEIADPYFSLNESENRILKVIGASKDGIVVVLDRERHPDKLDQIDEEWKHEQGADKLACFPVAKEALVPVFEQVRSAKKFVELLIAYEENWTRNRA